MLRKVLMACFIVLSLFNIFQNGYIILQSIECVLQHTIEYLTDLQSYIGVKRIKLIHSYLKDNDHQTKDHSSQNEEACPPHSYRTRIIQRKPLIIYIESFLTKNEIDHLIELAEPLFKPSTVSYPDGSYSLDEYRASTSAYINRQQTYLVKCLEQRFAQFQGEIDLQRMEPLQVVKYINNQQFKPHYDWYPQSNIVKNGGQRVTTFFSYLRSNCSMGETEFVNLQFNYSLHQKFCDILVCDENSSQYGIRFRPLSGNTIFWYNMDEHGQGDILTYHAGRPPGPNSYKIGLNTWTRVERFSWPFDKEQKKY